MSKKGVKQGGGSRKGVPNKATKEIKDMIQGALEQAGGQAYLYQQALENPAAFMSLLGKILPKDVKAEITGKDGGSLKYEQVTRTIIDPQLK